MASGRVEVTLFTISGLGADMMVRHVDTYEERSLRPSSREPAVIAQGTGGYVF